MSTTALADLDVPPLADPVPALDTDWRYPRAGSLLRRLNPVRRAWCRWLLSRAKHRGLAGHPRIAQRLARIVRGYEYPEALAFAVDGADPMVVARRRDALQRLSRELRDGSPRSQATSARLREMVPDAAFVDRYRVPFQFRALVGDRLPVGTVAQAAHGGMIQDLDGNWRWDLSGSYGVNLLGEGFYKDAIRRGVEQAEALGLVLGSYHPVVEENVRRLRAVSGLDQVSFHMSGTEAVMQAVRVARYHTGRSHLVRFAGSYHGWWDGVQAGVGNPRPPHEVYTLAEMSDATLAALRARDDIACVLVNPVHAMHPNQSPATDGSLVTGLRSGTWDRAAYQAWLRALREVCTERRIVLIFDEIMVGFRLAIGGAQEYFGVKADLVTYGKSLGGGLPVGVLCGRADLMRRFDPVHPVDVCFARGTFNAHPYVMTTMHEFLRALDAPTVRALYRDLDSRWSEESGRFNAALHDAGVPVRVVAMSSIWAVRFTDPGCFHWMLQYYLRAEGLNLGWIGTGRFIFPLDTSADALVDIRARFVRAAGRMRDDGWFSPPGKVTGRGIARRVLRETLSAALGRAPSDRSTPP